MENSTTTGGGASVGGGVGTQGGPFTGRDDNRYTRDTATGGVIINFDDPAHMGAPLNQSTLEALVFDVRRLIILVEGNSAYGSIGMAGEIRGLQQAVGRQAELSHRIDNLVFYNRISMICGACGLLLGGLALWIR
jgi:hypothetical protein